jgi:hypothetical protein
MLRVIRISDIYNHYNAKGYWHRKLETLDAILDYQSDCLKVCCLVFSDAIVKNSEARGD